MKPERLLSVERALLAGVLSDTAWNDGLMQLAGLAKASYLAIMTRDERSGQFHVLEPVEVSPSLLKDYEAEFREINPMNGMRDVLSADGEQYLDWTALGHTFIRRSRYYQDFMRSYDLGYLMAHRVDTPECPGSILSIHKLAGEAPFEQEDAGAIAAAHASLQQTLRLRQRLQGLQQAQLWQRSALDALSFPIMMVDPLGGVKQANRAAEAWLSQPQCPLACRGRVRDRDALLNILRQAQGRPGTAPKVASIRLSDENQQSGAICVALPVGEEDATRGTSGRIALLMVWPVQPREPARALLQQVFGLSVSEARVAEKLAQGHTPQEIAILQSLGESTIRSHIKTIFRKTHVHRQHDLARLLTELALIDKPANGFDN